MLAEEWLSEEWLTYRADADCTSSLELQMEEELDFAVTSAEAKARVAAIERALAALTTASDIIELRVRRRPLA